MQPSSYSKLYHCLLLLHSSLPLSYRERGCSTAAVLNSSPRSPPLCIFRMLLLSLQMFVLFERKCPAKCTSQDIPPWFQFEANVYIPFKAHISVQVNYIFIYLQRYMMTHSSVREDVTQRKSMNECSRNKVNFSGFPCSGSREQWTLCREQWTLCREQWTLCREQWTLCREQWTLCREQWTLCREQWTLCREQWTRCREQWTLCREQWTLCREQWTLCREQWTLCREQWTLCREQWTLCREQWTLCREQWTLCREQWTLCREQWTLCREQWTLCREQWTLCREQWTLCREQWTLCREQWTLCREQWTLCREHVNRNTVHAWSALLTSWLSESGVNKERHAKYAERGGARTGIENLCSTACSGKGQLVA